MAVSGGASPGEGREPATIATVVLALLLLGFLARLTIGVIRDFWVILIALMQP